MGKEQAMDVHVVHNQTGPIKTELVELDSPVSKKQRVTEYKRRLSQFFKVESSVDSNELEHVEAFPQKVELKKRRRYGSKSIEEVDVTSSYMPTPNYRLITIQEGFKKLKNKMEDLEEREKVLVPKLKHSLSMMQRMLPEMIPPSGSIEEVDVTSSYIPTPDYVDRLKIIQEGFEKSKKKMDDLEEREKVLVPKLKHSLSMLQRMLPEMIPPS